MGCCYLGVAVALWLWQALVVAARYSQPPCQGDEAQGELQGASGNICAPRCDPATFNCPSDIPYGSSAQPQCMLKDVDQQAHCALLCQVDSQCPSGSRCRQLQQIEVGVCLYPVSFTDWARSTVTVKKFAVGWPKSSGATASFQIAKTYTALQNLKSKYSIDDGDADMVTLKEFLSALSTGSGAAPAVSASGTGAAPVTAGSATSSSGWWSSGDFAPAKFQKDFNYFKDNVLLGGVPGLQKEVHDTINNLEHLDRRGVATDLFRSILMLALGYLAIGCCIKSQMQGARGMEMVPHISFWREYPGLVGDGIAYAQILAGGWLGTPMKGGSDDLTGGISSRSGGVVARGVGSFDAL